MTNLKRYIAAAILAGGLASAAHGIAGAEPASIDDGQSPRDVGASIESGSGTPGPSFKTPIDIPSVGSAPKAPASDASQAEWDKYAQDKRMYDQSVQERTNAIALEDARKKALAQKESTKRG